MRKWTVLLCFCISVIHIPSALAQTYIGDLTLTTQAEVDAFSYTEVSGTLTITGTDINDLSPLSGLENIGEILSIRDNPALTVVNGFDSLTNVGWGIYIDSNPNLVSFGGFDALVQTGSNIDFWYNDSLLTISGFSSLQTAGWSLEFGGHPLLTSIPEFPSLLTISSSLFILDNPSLTSITGFNALQHVDWSFQINGNASLSSLCGFYNYFAAYNPYTGGGAFNIDNNHSSLPALTTMQDVLDAGPCPIPLDVMMDELIQDVLALGLPSGIEKSLIKSLNHEKQYQARNKDASLTLELEVFISSIQSLERRGKLDATAAAGIISNAQAIIDAYGSP